MNKLYLFVFALLLFVATDLVAQSRTSITYAIGFPMGDLGDFITKTSFRGVTLDWRQMAKDNLGVGLSVGWNVFYEEADQGTYTLETVSLSGKQWRYSNHFPMLASVDFYRTQGQRINPYFGLGTGVIYTRRNTDMNLYTIEQEAWNFALQPQIGFEFNNSAFSAFTAIVKYYHGFKSGDFDTDQTYLSLNLGWTFMQ